jgi:hypothetical protein
MLRLRVYSDFDGKRVNFYLHIIIKKCYKELIKGM